MAYEHPREGALDYFPCRYGRSKLLFRGPRRRAEGDYIAVVGGSETYGKFVEAPYPALLEERLGRPVLNFGCLNAGPDVFAGEPGILELCGKARVTVLQLMGAQNLSNRFYAVHPRRNDRFLRASSLMKTVFREVDFTEFHFTRHMLCTLKARSPDKFALLEEELKAAWVARMKLLLEKLGGPVLLLWLEGCRADPGAGLGPDPVLVDAAMVAALRDHAAGLVHVAPSPAARAAGTAGMRFSALDAPAAAGLPGPQVHAEVAEALAPALARFLRAPRPARAVEASGGDI